MLHLNLCFGRCIGIKKGDFLQAKLGWKSLIVFVHQQNRFLCVNETNSFSTTTLGTSEKWLGLHEMTFSAWPARAMFQQNQNNFETLTRFKPASYGSTVVGPFQATRFQTTSCVVPAQLWMFFQTSRTTWKTTEEHRGTSLEELLLRHWDDQTLQELKSDHGYYVTQYTWFGWRALWGVKFESWSCNTPGNHSRVQFKMTQQQTNWLTLFFDVFWCFFLKTVPSSNQSKSIQPVGWNTFYIYVLILSTYQSINQSIYLSINLSIYQST